MCHSYRIEMYLCTRNYDLKRGGTFETAKPGTFHSVTAGTSIPLFTRKLRDLLKTKGEYRLIAELAYGGAMGDEKHGFIWVGCKNAAVEFALGGLVERAANLVEQQYVATMQQATGNGYALGLPLAESATTFTKSGVKTVFKIKYKVGAGGV